MGKFKEKVREEVKLDVGVVRDMSLKEKIIGAGIIALCLPTAAFILKGDSDQKAMIRKDVEAEAKAKVAGYHHIASGGNDPVPIFRSTNTATVAREDGSTCVVQYKTGGGSLGTLYFDNSANLVDFGTCTPRDQ